MPAANCFNQLIMDVGGQIYFRVSVTPPYTPPHRFKCVDEAEVTFAFIDLTNC